MNCSNAAVGDTCTNDICSQVNESKCKNRYLHPHPNLYLKETNKGLGLFCSTVIKKDTFITEYTGEVLLKTSEVYKERDTFYTKSTHTYMFKLGSRRVIDATHKGNWGRYLNHSCVPNCE